MQTSLKISDSLSYEFDDEAEYQGTKFISFKKVSEYKGNKKYQNLTVRMEHWEQFASWLFNEILEERKPDDDTVPF